MIDKISVSFYQETLEDKILLEILNRKNQRKFRTHGLKTIALEYYKLVSPELVKEVENEIKRKENGELNIVSSISNSSNNSNKTNEINDISKKKQIKGMESF